jgi:hypothetical protein
MTLMSYKEVMDSLQAKKRTPHLLLGNGFGMAYDSNIFSYNALYKFVEELEDPLLSKLFGIIKTKNFELIMEQLENTCQLLEAFESDSQLIEKIKSSQEKLKHSLIDAIKELHPEHVFSIPEKNCTNCAKFLSPFLEQGGHIFSTNYDLLLYWILMRCKLENCIDGFGRDREDDDYIEEPEYSELRWGKNKDKQNVHYLHGALPLFDTGTEVIKEEYSPQEHLLDKIKRRIDARDYPIFVTAGNGKEKLNHITHNQYLSFCYQTLQEISGSLVTFGFNFGQYDGHIIKAINKAAKHYPNKLLSIYIGVYSDDDSKYISSITHKFKCKVHQFDAKTATVWH